MKLEKVFIPVYTMNVFNAQKFFAMTKTRCTMYCSSIKEARKEFIENNTIEITEQDYKHVKEHSKLV